MPSGPAPGQIILERYRLDRLLGEGGMGSVWAATHLWMNKPVALKFLKPEVAGSEDAVARFMREARAASAVRHTNVVKIHDVLQTEDGIPAMVMDLLVGESLESKLHREQVIPLVELAKILVPVVSALGTAHAIGVVHRDLKPDNIFLELCEGNVVPRVLDFGIAKLMGTLAAETQSGGLTRTGAMLGTPYYMAPEQAFGEKDIDHLIDVWSLGVILYECLTGERPVSGDSFGQLLKAIVTGTIVPITTRAPHLPEDVRVLVTRMLSSDKRLRPQSMGEVATVLMRYTDVHADTFGSPVAPSTLSPLPPPNAVSTNGISAQTPGVIAPQPKRSAGWLVGGVVGVAASVLLAAVLYWASDRARGGPDPLASAMDREVEPSGPTPSAVATSEQPPDATAAASTTSSAAPSASPAAEKPHRAAIKSTHAPSKPPGNAPPPATASPTKAAPAAPTPTPSPTKLPGGVVGDTPF